MDMSLHHRGPDTWRRDERLRCHHDAAVTLAGQTFRQQHTGSARCRTVMGARVSERNTLAKCSFVLHGKAIPLCACRVPGQQRFSHFVFPFFLVAGLPVDPDVRIRPHRERTWGGSLRRIAQVHAPYSTPCLKSRKEVETCEMCAEILDSKNTTDVGENGW